MDQKGKNAIAIAVALVLGAGAFWYYWWTPQQASIAVIAAHADTLEALNTKIEREVKAGLESKIKADAERYTNELAGLRRLVPTQNEVPALLEAVSSAARASGLEVSQFVPDGVMTGNDFDMTKFRFGVIGPFHRVAEFLTTVASSPRILVPINVTMTAVGVGGIERKPRPDETFIDVHFGIMTYVAKTKPAGAK